MSISKTFLTLGSAAAMLFLASLANAQTQKGNWEIGFTGSYSALNAGNADIDLLLLDADVGYFVTDAIALSVSGGYIHADLDGMDVDAASVGVGADYHFQTGTAFVPYVGAGIQWLEVDLGGVSDDDMAWEGHAGIKQFVTENVAIVYELSYMEFDDLDLDGLTAGVGLTFIF